MKNPGKIIRQVYVSALSALTYTIPQTGATITVPVYDGDPVETVPDHFVKVTDVAESNDNNNNKFITNCLVTIDIITRLYKINDRSIVDDITGKVLNAIQPTTGGNGFDSTDFQFGPVFLESGQYLTNLNSDGYWIMRKVLVFSQILIEK